MKVIQVHNYYQLSGGEDGVVAAEASLLRSHGNDVVIYNKDNRSIGHGFALIKSGLKSIWNWQTYREFRELLQREDPDIVHCHNTFPLISPSIYWACNREGVPVVQTLHNYRLLCINAFLFREGRASKGCKRCGDSVSRDGGGAGSWICELCSGRIWKWPGVRYACYRGSRVGSAVVAVMIFFHWLIGTWSKKVTYYIALTEFQRGKMIDGGLPSEKILVKSNFLRADLANKNLESDGVVEDDQRQSFLVGGNPYVVFVGRLSPEKGCDVLIRAWMQYLQRVRSTAGAEDQLEMNCKFSDDLESGPKLVIIGDGPERTSLENLVKTLTRNDDVFFGGSVVFLGKKSKSEVRDFMLNAEALILPSVWYEGFPMTVLESFACGTPVVASDVGGMREIIREMQNGLKFRIGDFGQLSKKIEWIFSHKEAIVEMGGKAQRDFEEMYSDGVNYEALKYIYDRALVSFGEV